MGQIFNWLEFHSYLIFLGLYCIFQLITAYLFVLILNELAFFDLLSIYPFLVKFFLVQLFHFQLILFQFFHFQVIQVPFVFEFWVLLYVSYFTHQSLFEVQPISISHLILTWVFLVFIFPLFLYAFPPFISTFTFSSHYPFAMILSLQNVVSLA